MINISTIREQTPGIGHITHFNNAGAALPPASVIERVQSYLTEEALYGGYEIASKYRDERESIYTAIADMLNAQSNQIALMESATDAWQRAFYSIPLHSGDKIITSRLEYGSNAIAYIQRCRNSGASLEIIDSDNRGIIDVNQLEEALDAHTKVVSITHMPTNGGAVQPIEEIGQLITQSAYNPWYLVDACQSAGQYKLDMSAIQCDVLTATGRKYLRGPRGTGFLAVSERFLQDDRIEPAMLDHFGAQWTAEQDYTLRSDARRFERWEANWGIRLGLGEAVRYAHQLGLNNIRQRVHKLATELRNGLNHLPGYTVRDAGTPDSQSGIVTFTHDKMEAIPIRKALAKQSINVSVSTAGSARWDMEDRHLPSLVRASVHYYNSQEEINILGEALESIHN
jgi:selenocysteine lyase/cysteine desulfurase